MTFYPDHRLPVDKRRSMVTISTIKRDVPPRLVGQWIETMTDWEFEGIEVFFPAYGDEFIAARPMTEEELAKANPPAEVVELKGKETTEEAES